MTERGIAMMAIHKAAAAHGVAASEIMGLSRYRDVVRARVDAMRSCGLQGMSYSDIGRAFGRHHSTVMHLLGARTRPRYRA